MLNQSKVIFKKNGTFFSVMKFVNIDYFYTKVMTPRYGCFWKLKLQLRPLLIRYIISNGSAVLADYEECKFCIYHHYMT